MATYASISGIDPDGVSNFVLQALYEARTLAGVVSAVREDITAEAGDVVRVAALGATTVGTQNTPGGALAANDTGITNVAITLQKHFTRENVPTEVFEDQDPITEALLLTGHATALAQQTDIDVFAALDAATPGQSKTLATKGDLTDVYAKIVDLKAALKAAKVNPDLCIVHPDVEAQLLKETAEGVKNRSITLGADGSVATVAGLRLLVTAHANANAATVNLVQAVVIDSRRAVGEAWGRRPDTKTDFDLDTDAYEYLCTVRYGASVIDTASVGHVVNAAA